MTIEAGSVLDQYRLVEKIGEGGMGVVWKARDTSLERDVAIKLLPEELARDGGFLARFEREAKAVAALSHPNIVGIHGFGTASGQTYAVMELLEGQTLRELLGGGALPPRKAVEIARQVATGLDAAHSKGIVHRDLKPDNVFVTSDGRARVLDFGLATAFPGAESGSLTALATQPELTTPGTVMGTVGYMSPEQVRGEPADSRSDIFALGIMLHEMLTGKRPFARATQPETMTAILREDPPEIELGGGPAPRSLGRLIRRCLEKSPEQRFQSASDLSFALDNAAFDSSASSPALGPSEVAAATAVDFRRLIPWVVAALATAAAFVLGGQLLRKTPAATSRDVIHTSIQLPTGVRLAGWSSPAVALSPDERTLAFVGHRNGRQQLYLRRLDESEAVEVPGSDGAEGPFFSPDSRWVAFGAGKISGRSQEPRMLKRAPVGGGSTQPLVPLGDYVGGSWGTDGYIYYAEEFLEGTLRRVRETGGEGEPIFRDDRGAELAEIVAAWPQHFADGRRLLLTALLAGDGRAVVVDLETGALTDLGQQAPFSRYAPSGHLLFAGADAVLRALPVDPLSMEKKGAPAELIRDIAFTANRSAVFAVGGSGSAVYATGFVRGSDRVLSRLVRIDPADGSVERLPFEPEAFRSGTALAPDGRYLAAATWDGSLWIYDLERQTRLRLPSDGVDGGRDYPVWSPDGETIAYSQDVRGGGNHVYTQRADGTGGARLISGKAGENYASSWTPDGRELIVYHFSGMDRVPVAGEAEPVPIQLAAGGGWGTVSPDGRWLAYQSAVTGRDEVYVEPFPGGGAVLPVSSNGGARPLWSLNGEQLFFNLGCGHFAVDVRPGPQLELGRTRRLFEHCDPSGRRGTAFEVDDEGRFYLLEAVEESGVVESLDLVLNWTQQVSAAFGDGSASN